MKIRIFVPKEEVDLKLRLPTGLVINRFVLQKLLKRGAQDCPRLTLDRGALKELKAVLQRLKAQNGGSFPLVDVETSEGEIVKITL